MADSSCMRFLTASLHTQVTRDAQLNLTLLCLGRRRAKVGDVAVAVGAVVALAPDAEDEERQLDDAEAAGGPPLGLVQALWQTSSGEPAVPIHHKTEDMSNRGHVHHHDM